jgi:hypothetical protein
MWWVVGTKLEVYERLLTMKKQKQPMHIAWWCVDILLNRWCQDSEVLFHQK